MAADDRARSSAARPSRCWSRRPASSASRCRSTRFDAALADGVRGARRRQRLAGGAGDHDDRSVSQGSGGARVASAAATVTDRRHGQGLGHDRADDGDDARRSSRPTRRCRSRCSTARCAKSVDDTFNAITVDGECSTNDCVDAARQRRQRRHHRRGQLRRRSSQALRAVCLRAGARHRAAAAKARPSSSRSPSPARRRRPRRARRRKAIANSPLVKTAIHGGDPNWGRLIAVAGRAGVAFELSRAAVTIGPIVLFKDGRPYDEAAPEAAEYLKDADIAVRRPRRRRARRRPSGPAT